MARAERLSDIGSGIRTAQGSGLRIFAIARSQEVKNALSSAASGINGSHIDVRIGELKELGTLQIHAERPDIVVLDIDVNDPQEMSLLNRIVQDRHGVGPVLATAASISADGVRRLVRQGIDDFLPQPMSQRDVVDAFDQATRKLRQMRISGRPLGKVISFVKAHGGVGATTLAVHTAYDLMKPSRRETANVCLIDLDLHYGDAALYLDLEAKPEVVEIIREPDRLDADLLRSAVSVHKSGLAVLTAPRAPVPLEALTPETVTRLLQSAREEYQYVVVDLPPALTTWIETVLGASDQIVVVTELNVSCIRQTRRLLDLLNDEGLYNLPLSIVVNRYKRRWGDRLTWRGGEKALGRPFDHWIPSDYAFVVDALNQGRPLYDVKRRSAVGKAIRRMTDGLIKAIKDREAAEASTAAQVAAR